MDNLMIMYHGSSVYFDRIDVRKGLGYKDFGRGFYLSQNIQHARANSKKRATGRRFVYSIGIPKPISKEFIQKTFRVASEDWLDFVVGNRASKFGIRNYDIIFGPTADARAVDEISLYKRSKDITKPMLIKNLKTHVFPRQACIRTQELANKLVFVEIKEHIDGKWVIIWKNNALKE